MNGGEDIKTKLCKGAMINPAIETFLFKGLIEDVCIILSPFIQCFRRTPVCGWNSIKLLLAFIIKNRIVVLIKDLFTTLLLSPSAILVEWSNGNKHVNMRIRNIIIP